MRPEPFEDWHLIWTPAAVTTEVYTDPVKVACINEANIQGASLVEVKLAITCAGSTDDLLLNIYTCPDGLAANRSTSPIETRRLSCSTKASILDTFTVPWTMVASGVQFGLVRDGTTDTITVDEVAVRRYHEI